jgi:hypothetical protein
MLADLHYHIVEALGDHDMMIWHDLDIDSHWLALSDALSWSLSSFFEANPLSSDINLMPRKGRVDVANDVPIQSPQTPL